MYIDPQKIIDIFEVFNDNKIEYVLLRNIDDELPSRFQANKDIDILVKPDDKKRFRSLLKEQKWTKMPHPWDFGKNFVFLYGMDKFEMYCRDKVHLDISYQLSCRSTNDSEWMPVDQQINDSVWRNKKKNIRYNWFEMEAEDQLVHLITRCVFDKRTFEEGYIIQIEKLLSYVNKQLFTDKLKLFFF